MSGHTHYTDPSNFLYKCYVLEWFPGLSLPTRYEYLKNEDHGSSILVNLLPSPEHSRAEQTLLETEEYVE